MSFGPASVAAAAQQVIHDMLNDLHNNWSDPSIQTLIKNSGTLHHDMVKFTYEHELGGRAEYQFWLDSLYAVMPNRFF